MNNCHEHLGKDKSVDSKHDRRGNTQMPADRDSEAYTIVS